MTAETTSTYPMTPDERSVFTPSPEDEKSKEDSKKPKDPTKKKKLQALKG